MNAVVIGLLIKLAEAGLPVLSKFLIEVFQPAAVALGNWIYDQVEKLAEKLRDKSKGLEGHESIVPTSEEKREMFTNMYASAVQAGIGGAVPLEEGQIRTLIEVVHLQKTAPVPDTPAQEAVA